MFAEEQCVHSLCRTGTNLKHSIDDWSSCKHSADSDQGKQAPVPCEKNQ